MPIIIKDFSWKQSADKIFITVPLKGIDSSKVDIFVSEYYVKLHYSPFIFEIFLKYPIDDRLAKCCFTGKEALLELDKKDLLDWDYLEADLTKCEKMNLRANAINEVHMKTTAKRDERNALRNKLEKFSVSQAIEFETRQRNKIEEDRNKERDTVMRELEEWRLCQEKTDARNVGDGYFERTLAVTVNGDSELTVENAVDNQHSYSKCDNFIDETIEINFDNEGLWFTNLPNKENKFRNMNEILNECELYETTSVDLLLDETGVTLENSVSNATFLDFDPFHMDACQYEIEEINKDLCSMLDFEKEDAGDELTIVKKSLVPDFTVEGGLDMNSMFEITPEPPNIVVEAKGAIPLEGSKELECNDVLTEKLPLTKEIKDDSLNLPAPCTPFACSPDLSYAECSINGEREKIITTKSADCLINNECDNFISTKPADCLTKNENYKHTSIKFADCLTNDEYYDKFTSTKSVDLDVIDELDEEEDDDELGISEMFAQIQKDYLQVPNIHDNYPHDSLYSEFFKTPQSNKSDTSIGKPCVDTDLDEESEVSNEILSTQERDVYLERDIKEYVIDSEGEMFEKYTDKEIYTNMKDMGKECQQVGVEILIDESGFETNQYNKVTECDKESAKKFFTEGEIFESSNDRVLKEIIIENEFDSFTDSMKELSSQGTQCESDNIECLLKEQNNLLKEHIRFTEEKFDELSKKIDKCDKTYGNKESPASGDSSKKCSNEKKSILKKDKTAKEKIVSTTKTTSFTKSTGNISKTTVQKIDRNKQAPPKTSQFHKKVMRDIEKKVIPPPRKSSKIRVTFSERIFPTPSRESSSKDEQQWLKNVCEYRRATGFVSEDLRPEEQDPMWCKAKGDEFYKSGNHLGAISAYSHGIKLCDKIPALYSNRSACHLAVGNYNKCIEDCSRALDLLQPACASNSDSRAKCIARRAMALTRAGMLSKGIDEMKAACAMQPDNEQLQEDLYSMERAWEQCPDSD